MSPKRSKPLYELIEPRNEPVTRPVRPVRNRPAPSDGEGERGWLSPGRVVRVPVGYALLAGAVCLSLIVGSFVLGYVVRDKEVARDRLAEVENGSATTNGIADPIAGAPVNDGLLGGSTPTQNMPAPIPTPIDSTSMVNTTPQVNPSAADVSGMVIVEGDTPNPLKPGVNYFVVVTQFSKEDAVAAATFLAERGVPTVVRSSIASSGSWMVVTQQGFASPDHRGPAAETLVRKIEQIGRVYQQDFRGPTNFRGPYPWLFK